MKRLLLAATALAFVASPLTAGPVEDYEQLREDVWEDMLDDSPTLATSVGDRRGDGKLGDMSMAAYEENIAEDRAFLARLNAIDESALPEDLRVDYAILKSSLEDGLESAQFAQDRYILFTNRGGWFTYFASLPYSSPLFTLADYESYVARLEAFGAMNEAGLARSREAVARGLTQACEPMEGFENQVSGQIDGQPNESPFWRPFAERPSTISEGEWEALRERARAALTNVVFPAYRDFLDFYRDEYAPKCRTGLPGISETEGGDDYYAYRVRSYTTTDMTPDEVHQLGLSEVARIRAEMEEVAAEAGFDTREAFIEHLRTDPQYYMTDEDEYLRYAAALAKEIDGWMPKLFGNLPRQPYTVSPIPAAQAPGNTTAYYEPGSLATGQPGIYRVNLTELDQRPL